MLISLICCYNNKKMLDDFLIDSLQQSKNSEYELIDIDNRNNLFSSVAKAYNQGIQKAKGEWIMFCHQDIAFRPDFITEISSFLEKQALKKECIYGFAGIDKTGVVYSNIQRKDSRQYIVKNQLFEPKSVVSLDECCFIIRRDYLFSIGGFDEKICDNWHMYCVELCLRCLEQGGDVICVPNIVYHKTGRENISGLLDFNFLKSFYRVAKRYRNNHHILYAPCYIAKTHTPYLEIQLFKTYLKFVAKKLR